jgi:hypothetical protein
VFVFERERERVFVNEYKCVYVREIKSGCAACVCVCVRATKSMCVRERVKEREKKEREREEDSIPVG